jgi:riboflavin transporter FmnP
MKNKHLRLIVQTALLIAITIVFQQLRLLIGSTLPSTIIIGSLVNLCLIVAAATVGWRGSIFVAVLSPVVAFAQGHLALPLLIPFVAAGNFVIAVVFELVERHKNTQPRLWTGAVVAAVAKFALLYVLIVLLFVPVLLPNLGLPEKQVGAMTAALSVTFSWPQLVTALIGGAVAVPVILRLRRSVPANE